MNQYVTLIVLLIAKLVDVKQAVDVMDVHKLHKKETNVMLHVQIVWGQLVIKMANVRLQDHVNKDIGVQAVHNNVRIIQIVRLVTLLDQHVQNVKMERQERHVMQIALQLVKQVVWINVMLVVIVVMDAHPCIIIHLHVIKIVIIVMHRVAMVQIKRYVLVVV